MRLQRAFPANIGALTNNVNHRSSIVEHLSRNAILHAPPLSNICCNRPPVAQACQRSAAQHSDETHVSYGPLHRSGPNSLPISTKSTSSATRPAPLARATPLFNSYIFNPCARVASIRLQLVRNDPPSNMSAFNVHPRPLPLRHSHRPQPLLRPRVTTAPLIANMKHSQPLVTAAAAAISLTLSQIEPPRQMPVPPPAAALVSAVPQTMPVASAQIHTAPIVGVAKSPIHDYQPFTAPESTLDDAHREFVLAIRLVTAVLLGVLVGVERRATRLNLGVRSVTLLSLSAALVAVTASCMPLVHIADMAALLSGTVVAAATYLTAVLRKSVARNIRPMSAVVGFSVAMGMACGCGLSLMSAACYLALIAIMRADSIRERRKRRIWRVHGEDNDMVFRIATVEKEETSKTTSSGKGLSM